MNYLALDLEFNQPSNKIIQVGIAIGNPDQGVLVCKGWYVDPNEDIDEHITHLTGIDDQIIILDATPMSLIAEKIGKLITEYNCFVNPVQWGGGDAKALLAEFRLNQIPFQFFGRREIDVKTIYSYLSFAQGRKPSGGLASAMGRYGMKFQGTAHRADIDAENTLRFFFVLLDRQKQFEKTYNEMRQMGKLNG
jgi:inhibitor of KinA sporulation pathway (predicted exonuclease)